MKDVGMDGINLEEFYEDGKFSRRIHVSSSPDHQSLLSIESYEDSKHGMQSAAAVAYKVPTTVNFPNLPQESIKVNECSFCGKKFARGDALKRHMLIHAA